VLVSGQHDVDVELIQESQEVPCVGDDVALPACARDRDEVVVDDEDLHVIRAIELLPDPVIGLPPDVPLVQVGL
jgi:hypothetical protein